MASSQAIVGPEALAIVWWVILAGVAAVVGFLVFDLTVGRVLPSWKPVDTLNDLCRGARRVCLGRMGPAAWLLSVAIQVLTVLAAWLIAEAIGAPTALGVLFLLMPVVVLVAMAPVSVAGWGLREGAMITAFTLAGQKGSDAFAISVLLGLALLIVGAIGGLVWIAGGDARRTPPPPLNAEKETTA